MNPELIVSTTLDPFIFAMVIIACGGLGFFVGILACWNWKKERDALRFQCQKQMILAARLSMNNAVQVKYLSKIGKENEKYKKLVKYKDDQLYHLAQIFYQVLKAAEAGLKMQTNRAATLRMIIDSIRPMFPDEQPPTRGKKPSNLSRLKKAEDKLRKEGLPEKIVAEESKKQGKTQAAINQAALGAVDLDPERKIQKLPDSSKGAKT